MTLWHGDVDVERAALEEHGRPVQRPGPAWKIQTVFSGNSDFALQKLLTAMAGGKAPDIMYQYGSSLANLARSPKIVNMGDLIAKTPGYDWNDFYPSERQAATVNGKVGPPGAGRQPQPGLQQEAVRRGRRGAPDGRLDLGRLPRRREEAHRTLATKTYGWAYVNDGSEDTVWRYLAMLWQAGGDLLTPDNKAPAFDSPAGLAALQLLHDMAVTDKSVYLDQGNGNYLNLFNSGKIAMLWTGPWDLSSINADVGYGVTLLPADVATTRRSPGRTSASWSTTAPTAHGRRWQFVTWLTSAKVHLQFAIATGDLPIRESETKLPDYQTFLKKYPAEKVFVDNLNNVNKARPNIPPYAEDLDRARARVQFVLLGKLEPQQALDPASQQVDAVLAAPAP